ncbi:transposase DDE domain protein [Striga asiatica]|uniref:Transposase DDE domain protein n=1 Tax=Striga asiatica TaxID=4170 RepID=A0A5A7R0E2_STRAF|nr:transposase DDE domain protein [Striga asiatica]
MMRTISGLYAKRRSSCLGLVYLLTWSSKDRSSKRRKGSLGLEGKEKERKGNEKGSFSPTLAEALFIQFWLRFASTMRVKIQQVTTDCLEVVQGLIVDDSHHPLGIFFNILALLDSLDCGRCQHTHRFHNEIAHAIAGQ